ncbi:MAG TPA: DUF4190 domain-containing protein [Candidatus Saccharimonadales bacterium]|nr:DUF4190 domain-containing protein [Candidatus Saccharimonadales bacterium]
MDPSQPEQPPVSSGGNLPVRNPARPPIVLIGFILAFIIPLVGLIVSILAKREVTKKSLPGRSLAVAGIVIGGIFTTISAAFLILMLLAIAALGGFHTGNSAESASKPLATQIESIGGKKICSNGDGGHGIDNTTPWYDVYYTVPDNAHLTGKVKDIASSAGYNLSVDRATINQLQGIPDSNGSITEPYGGEKYNPKSDYLAGHNGDKNLTIKINRQTEVALYCDSGQYGRQQTAGNGVAILELSFTLPDNSR